MPKALEKVCQNHNGHHSGIGRWWDSFEITPCLLRNEFTKEDLPKTLPEKIIVVDSEVGRRFSMGRHIWGWQKIRLIKEITKHLVQPVVKVFRESHGEVTQFVPLNGAIPMQIGKALHHALIEPFTTAPIATVYLEAERKYNEDKKCFTAKVQRPLKDYPKHATVVIVDTCCASGETLKEIIRKIIQWYKEEGKVIDRIIFFTACGSLEAVAKSAAVCERNEIEFIPVLSVGLHRVFPIPGVLSDPLTDLSPISETAIMPESFSGSASFYYQERNMCAVGDVGDSIGIKFEEYLLGTLAELAILEMNLKASPWREMLRQIPKNVFDRLQVRYSRRIREYIMNNR